MTTSKLSEQAERWRVQLVRKSRMMNQRESENGKAHCCNRRDETGDE
jgi:hypothetical protein